MRGVRVVTTVISTPDRPLATMTISAGTHRGRPHTRAGSHPSLYPSPDASGYGFSTHTCNTITRSSSTHKQARRQRVEQDDEEGGGRRAGAGQVCSGMMAAAAGATTVPPMPSTVLLLLTVELTPDSMHAAHSGPGCCACQRGRASVTTGSLLAFESSVRRQADAACYW